MNEQKKFLIIGISGTTNSGKTTLVSKLNKLFPQAQTMGQDHYFLAPDDKRLEQYYVPEVDHCNWEQFGALEMDRMIEDVEKWKEQHICYDSDPVPVLIIEGFLIFNHSVLTNYFHKKYFLTIDKETCMERRRHRSYNPPDKPGYFEKVVWPMYLINKKEIEAQTDIVYIDGTEDQEKVVQQITEDIEQLMVSHHS
ncbi:nicotinamide riboside kinase 1-like isoform X1 [Babylonia areolata]|uniref:nicotinamide riboside kinase 1-like isoform X1 n=1 Tax=Babylonia areolata TaxID=304850 RepID=UPI003FD655CB